MERGLPGVVLGTPAGVAWVTGGANRPIDRGAAVDVIWAVVGPATTAVVTTVVEVARFEPELSSGEELHAVDWWDEAAFRRCAAEVLDAAPGQIGSDVSGLGLDLADDLVALRLDLFEEDAARMRAAGSLAASAVETALERWTPGESDYAIAARIESAVVASGGDCPVVIVGGDDRVRAFRHPLSTGHPVQRLAMAVLVARFGGLHVALTRYAAVDPEPELLARLDQAAFVRARVLEACIPGSTFGDALQVQADAYEHIGHPGEWRFHYQGGPIGFAQREFEISPAQPDSRWWGTQIPPASALAWNPSLPGGAKDEDTYLVTAAGARLMTSGTWPRTATGQAQVLVIR